VTFEERLRDAIDEDAIFVPEEGSVAATVAITEAVNTEVDSLLSALGCPTLHLIFHPIYLPLAYGG
jgi:hypothetical protein